MIFEDIVRVFNKDKPVFSRVGESYLTGEKRITMSRIDHIWSTNIHEFEFAEIEEITAIHSDHRPIMANKDAPEWNSFKEQYESNINIKLCASAGECSLTEIGKQISNSLIEAADKVFIQKEVEVGESKERETIYSHEIYDFEMDQFK